MKSLWKDDRKAWEELLNGPDDVIPKRLTDEYPSLHWCSEFDGLPVDEGMPEWEYCSCTAYKKHLISRACE